MKSEMVQESSILYLVRSLTLLSTTFLVTRNVLIKLKALHYLLMQYKYICIYIKVASKTAEIKAYLLFVQHHSSKAYDEGSVELILGHPLGY